MKRIFIRKRKKSERGATPNSRAMNTFPAMDGYEIVYMPYGPTGDKPGYYYRQKETLSAFARKG